MPVNPAHKTLRLGLSGIQLSRDSSLIDDRKLSFIKNMRAYQSGELRPRYGQTATQFPAPSASKVRALKLLNDSTTTGTLQSKYNAIIGTTFYQNSGGSWVSKATGLSGNRSRLIPFRPDKTSQPWMYLLDSLVQGKININGTYYNLGISSPITPCDAKPSGIAHKIINDTSSTSGWTNTGTAGAASLLSYRINFTIPAGGIIYDSGTTGWANILPASMDNNFQPGSLITFSGGTAETSIIESIYPLATGVVISNIKYDSGTTGLCTIHLSSGSDIKLNTILSISNGTAEYVRVLSIVKSEVEGLTIRTSTTLTHTSSSTITGVKSFRTYTLNNHAAGEVVRCDAIRSTTSGSGVATLTKTSTLDLSTSNILATRNLQSDDEVHLSIRVSDPSLLTELQVILDIDTTTNDGTRNAFYYPVNPSSFVGAVDLTSTTLTATQVDIQRDEIRTYNNPDYSDYYRSGDPYSPYGSDVPFYNQPIIVNVPTPVVSTPTTEIIPGDSQWTELRIKLKDFIRIGTDTQLSWKDVKALIIKASTTGVITLDISSWWIGGTFGPDCGDIGQDYNYTYTYRSREGVVSNPSPALRTGIRSRRQANNVYAQGTSDAQVAFIDIYRIGGTLNSFRYVGTVNNPGASQATFYDYLSDDEISGNEPLNRENYAPFPILDTPRSGTCSVIGTVVTSLTGDTFNTSWSPGSAIIFTNPSTGVSTINYLYNQPSSSTVLELVESAGYNANISWSIPEPLILNSKLPYWFGPFGSGFDQLYFFAVGDPFNPGTLYWTNPSSMDTTSKLNKLEVTSPSEPLIGGALYDGQPYLFSQDKMYRIYLSGDQNLPFIVQEVANSKGAVSNSAITSGESIFFISRDGIYVSNGGQPQSLTDRDLYPIFPHDGISGTSINGVIAPNYQFPDDMSLEWIQDTLYFDYKGIDNNYYTLVMDASRSTNDDIDSARWISFDSYANPVTLHYLLEGTGESFLLCGTTVGTVHQLSKNGLDVSTPIDFSFITKSEDANEPLTPKQWSDVTIEANTNGATCTVDAWHNSLVTTLPVGTIITSTRDVKSLAIPDQSRSLAIQVSGSTTTNVNPKFYAINVSGFPRPNSYGAAKGDWNDAGSPGAKFIQGIIITADTFNTSKTFSVYADGIDTGQNITISHNGMLEKAYSFNPPFIANTVRLVPDDTVLWQNGGEKWIFEPEPELTTTWTTQWMSHDLTGFIIHAHLQLSLASTSTVVLSIDTDQGINFTQNIPTTGGVQKKILIWPGVLKGKLFKYSLTSATNGFRVYKSDLEVRLRRWGSAEALTLHRPFGQDSHISGARI